MSAVRQSSVRNRLLSSLSPEDFAVLQPHLKPVNFDPKDMLAQAGETIQHVHFIESGICSVLGAFGEDRLEVGMAGPEGMTAIPVVLGMDEAPQSLMVQAQTEALQISPQTLRGAMRQNQAINAVLLRYVHCFMIQTMQTAYANAEFTIEQRLARWILMTDDRITRDDLPLTHEFLSLMIGTRRASITEATHVLEGEGLIRATRGRITVRDRSGLQARAGSAYGVAEREYDRLFGAKAEVSHAEVSP